MTQQGLRQKTVRALTGRALTYTGDWHALFDQEGIPTGTYEGRQLRWLNQVMGTSYQDIRQARQIFAEQNGAFNWASMGEFEAFSLDAYMASQSDGFWFDLTRSDTMFREDVGPTPADGAGEVIGLALSQRLWGGQTRTGYLASASELVTPGAWTLTAASGATATESPAGTLNLVGSGATDSALAKQAITTVVGRVYRFAADLVVGAGTITLRLGTTSGASDVYTAPYSTNFELYFVAKSATTYIEITKSGSTATVSAISAKEVTRYAGIQSTTNFKPKVDANGAKFDGADDRLPTLFALTGAGDVFAFDYADIPSTIAATQILFGSQDGSSNGAYVGVTTAGALRVKVGQTVTDSTGIDLRGGQRRVGYFTVGNEVFLYADGAIVGSGTWTGSLPTTAWYLGAVNSNGTAAAFFGGSLRKPLAGRDTINLARANQITEAIAA